MAQTYKLLQFPHFLLEEQPFNVTDIKTAEITSFFGYFSDPKITFL